MKHSRRRTSATLKIFLLSGLLEIAAGCMYFFGGKFPEIMRFGFLLAVIPFCCMLSAKMVRESDERLTENVLRAKAKAFDRFPIVGCALIVMTIIVILLLDKYVIPGYFSVAVSCQIMLGMVEILIGCQNVVAALYFRKFEAE